MEGAIYLPNKLTCMITTTGCNVIFKASEFLFLSNIYFKFSLLCDSKAQACFTVDKLLQKLNQQSIPVEAQSWWRFSTGKAALWP